MKIKLKELGSLKQAEFELGELSIICGQNNTGKTYATYALFGFLQRWKNLFEINIKSSIIKTLLNDGTVSIDLNQYLSHTNKLLTEACKRYSESLATIFAASEKHFSNSQFEIQLDKQPSLTHAFELKIRSENAELFTLTKAEHSTKLIIAFLVGVEKNTLPTQVIKDIISKAVIETLFTEFFPNPFISSIERTGAVIFSNELDFSRNRLLKEMHNLGKDADPRELLFKSYQDYALPVEQNVDFIRNLKKISKKTSYIAEHHPDILTAFAHIIGGEYTVSDNGEAYFKPKKSKTKLSMDESSSSIRSLLDIGFYLHHEAQKGDLLIVDEPELSLHPENQRRVARLFARLINIGIKVFITTHSDYIVKEINTLIMLNHDSDYLKRIATDEGYQANELLNAEPIKVYIAEEALIKLDGKKRRSRCHSLIAARIDPELGIEARSFDNTIDTMNRIQEAIFWRDVDE